jgi:hypothetical protein
MVSCISVWKAWTDGDETLVDEIAEEIYNYTKGDPQMVKFYVRLGGLNKMSQRRLIVILGLQ